MFPEPLASPHTNPAKIRGEYNNLKPIGDYRLKVRESTLAIARIGVGASLDKFCGYDIIKIEKLTKRRKAMKRIKHVGMLAMLFLFFGTIIYQQKEISDLRKEIVASEKKLTIDIEEALKMEGGGDVKGLARYSHQKTFEIINALHKQGVEVSF